MAEDCPDGDYLGAYSRFFSEFVARVNPYDQLPVSVSSYNVTEAEIVGEIINVTLQYLNQTQCPASLQAHLVHQVIQEIKSMCKKQPEDCGFKSQEQAYTSLKLMQAITSKVNEICTRYLDNSRLALLPPPPCTPLPQIAAGGSKNCRRKMEDRYVVLHDLHSIFGIEDDSIANYYAVFDGHAGQDAAVYCASHLHQYLAESIYYPTDPERALRDAFLTTDRQFIEKSQTQKLYGGTTAVCTLILNKRLYVAWVGDSTAMLIKRDNVVQLVNPHRLHREDEVQRIRKAGGTVMQSMGTMRVNGVLGVSRAIGDVRYKPFVTGEPEIKSVPLDGTEDFLILATDGLTDYLEPAEILTVLYYEIQRNPNGFRRAYQVLVQWAKHAGSEDNITVVVVLLTPASAIAARPLYAHPYHRLQVNDILEKMNSKDKPLFLDIDDAHNAINSNILKQAMISQESRNHDDAGILAASNGKHENGDADYDYSDLGPETDVDAVDDVATMPVKNLSYEFYDDSDSAHDENQPGKDLNVLDNMDVDESMNANLNANTDVTHEPIAGNNLHDDDEDDDDDDDNDDDDDDDDEDNEDNDNDNDDNGDNDDNDHNRDHVHDNNDNDVADEIALSKAQVLDESPKIMHEVIHEKMNNQVCELLGEGIGDEEMRVKNDEQVDDAQDVVDEAGPVDYDDSPPSPQANKPLQHALIHEPDNVADSEDSEDEWNYYRIDPNKEKDSVTPVDEPQQTKNVEETDVPELAAEDIESKIQSEGIEEDIKCESPKEEESPKLINTEISTEDRMEEKPIKLEDRCVEEQDQPKDMDFQLNPDAAEFIPISPQFMGTRMNLVEDYPVSGSPFKQVPQMDDIQVPSQSEFEKEVCQRPREVEVEEKEYQNGDNVSCRTTDYTDFMPDQQKATTISGNMDDSEISSTKAEFGDESAVSFLTASEFHRTGISAIDESFSSSDREYDIAKDPMAMSFTPSDFEAAFDKSVDLNAVHNLSNTDLEDKNGIMEKEEDEFMAESPNMEVDSKNVITTGSTTEELLNEKAFSDKFVNILANLSRQQENTFIEHANESETNSVDFLNLRSKSSQLEQEENVKYDHSPLTENYSAEFESKKEPVSIDNEQPLSPLSVDIDETKLMDEASEDTAALAGSDLQKDICSNEADTPSSLSPVPDAMESDSVIATMESAQAQSPTQFQSSLHADAPEFIPTQYNFQSYGMESNEVVSRSSAAETIDVCQMSRTEETADSYQTYSTEAGDASELIQQDIVSNVQFDEKEVDDSLCTKSPVQGTNLLDFAEEQQDVCVKHAASLMTPSLSPQELQEKPVDDIVCSMECPIDIGQKLDVTESKDVPVKDETEETTNSVEEPMEPTISTETMEAVEPKAEPVEEFTLNLSDSMQEFTGLENQLQPTEEEILKSEVNDLEEEIIRKEESKNVTVELEKLTEPAVEVECMIQERQEIEELLPEVDKPEIKDEPETEIEQLKLEEPKVDRIEVKEPEIKDPEVEESEIKEPEVNEAEIKEPEIMEPQIKEPEVKELEIKEPEIMEPEIKESEIMEPEIKEPEIMEPEIKEPEVKELEIKEPDVKELEIKEPEVKEIEIKEPEAKETEIKEPEAKETEIMEPEIKELKITESEIKVPEITESEIKEPEIMASEIKEPEIMASEIKEPEIMASEIKEPEVKKPEDVKELGEVKELEIEKTVQVSENKIVEAAATAAVTAAAVTAGAVAAQSKTKSKVSAAKPMKSSSKTPAPKSVPTSPSKTPSSTARTPTTAAKKPSTPSRPKDLDAPKKSTVSTAAAVSKPSVSKTATKTTTSTTTTKPTSRTNVSSVSKPKPVATTASPKPTSTDKKPTANGDVKPLSKPTATKPSSKTPSMTKTTLVKTSTTRLSSGTTTKPKPASATTTTIKSSTTPKSSSTATNASNTTTAASTRPKTAPAVGNAMKTRLNTAKSPIIDKQVKETANKQISMGRTSTAASKTTRLSTSGSTTTTVKRVSSTTKTTTAASPIKKSTTVTKVSKTSSTGKTTIDKGKVLQNGVSEINALIDSMIDDVPKKDLSPVVTPNDNQLIMSSD